MSARPASPAVFDEHKIIPEVARNLNLSTSALRQWVEHARTRRRQEQAGLTAAEHEELTTEFPIRVLCRVLEVSRGWVLRRGRSIARAEQRRKVRSLPVVREAHEQSRKTYGNLRVQTELAPTHGVRAKQEADHPADGGAGASRARVRQWFKCATMGEHHQAVAANLVARNFEAAGRIRRRGGDTAELVAANGKRLLLVMLR